METATPDIWPYVWSAYAICIGVMLCIAASSALALRNTKAKLEQLRGNTESDDA